MTGVKYIDLENIDLVPNGNAVTIKGIYNAIKSTRKRIVFTNVKLAGSERHDIYGSVFDSVNKYSIVEVIETGIRIFEISNNDTIKFITKTWAQLNA